MFALSCAISASSAAGPYWTNYTAYEIRIIGALVHLGKRAERAGTAGVLPLGPAAPAVEPVAGDLVEESAKSGHLGDVPHTWIASEYMLVFTCLFAYEREADDALVIGAGVEIDGSRHAVACGAWAADVVWQA